MEKIKNYLKNKSIGYFIVLADALLALIVGVVFFLTYKGSMPNPATGNAPESIGIFLLVGFVVEVVALALPQYRFIHIIAIAMFGFALYKEIFVLAPLIADIANNVFYQGGDFGRNFFYFLSTIVIMASGVVAVFLGFYKSEEEAAKDMPLKGNVIRMGTVATGAFLVIASVLAGNLITNSLLDPEARDDGEDIEESYDPITDEIKAAAMAYVYDFDPESVVIKEQETWNYSDATLSGISVYDSTRSGGLHIVYHFEGSYAEGYQGDYSESYASIYLWEDGIFSGKVRDTNVKGYWFNSSIAEGQDDEGNDIKDCLRMVSNVSNYDSIITQEAGGFYERSAYVYLNMGWGNRSIIINGYKYYPNVALFIDSGTDAEAPTFKVGDRFDRNSWVAKRVQKDLNYSAVFKASEVTWADGTGIQNGQILTTAGEYEVTATWGGFTATKTVIVTE